ncbi:MAG TPA: acetolactate synthase [Porticoccaceae bacterium]|nr:acetolactate synthase [Porticoccaceae bacterium]HCO60913.1 acetolactate synthase [Porticoccaceae bacterium]
MNIYKESPLVAKREQQQTYIEVTDFGDLLLAYLQQLDVEYVFGIPGGAIEPFYNALARSDRQGGPRTVVARHEAGAAYMADGYSRNSGKLGVVCATTGPGATNLITGVAATSEYNIPLLVITAQTPLASFGASAVQESSCTAINTVALYQQMCRYSTLISHPDQFERKLVTAIMTAFSERGPAHISVPMDIWHLEPKSPEPAFNLPALLDRPSLFDTAAVDQLCREMTQCSNPVFLIGDEAAEAIGLILSVALKINAHLIVTPQGKGLVSPYHPLFRGVIGVAGHQNARELMQSPDIDRIFVIGAHLGQWATSGWDIQAFNNRITHIEENEINLAKTPMAGLHVRGRIATVFETVLGELSDETLDYKAVGKRQNTEPADRKRAFKLDDETGYVSDASPIKPQRLMRELPNIFPAHTHYLADVGNSFAWAIHYLHPYDRRIAGRRDAKGGLFRATLDFAPMGWAIGSAVGTALAHPGEPVVCITGDGAMLMSGQEITVAIQEQLPVIYVVLNDHAFGMVKHGQQMTGAEPIAFDLPKVDFAEFAKAMGAQAFTINFVEDLVELDGAAICRHPGPTLLDVRIDPDEVPPIGGRTDFLRANS